MVYLNKVTEGCGARIAAKLEFLQPSFSVKDRWLIFSLSGATVPPLAISLHPLILPSRDNLSTPMVISYLLFSFLVSIPPHVSHFSLSRNIIRTTLSASWWGGPIFSRWGHDTDDNNILESLFGWFSFSTIQNRHKRLDCRFRQISNAIRRGLFR